MLNYDSWTFLSFERRFQMLAFFKGHAWLPPRVREAWACCVLWLACSLAPKVLGHCLRFFRRFFPSTFGVSVNLDFMDRPLTLKNLRIRNVFLLNAQIILDLKKTWNVHLCKHDTCGLPPETLMGQLLEKVDQISLFAGWWYWKMFLDLDDSNLDLWFFSRKLRERVLLKNSCSIDHQHDKTIADHRPLTTANDKTIADHQPLTTANDKTIADHQPLTTANDKTIADHQPLTTANDEKMMRQ